MRPDNQTSQHAKDSINDLALTSTFRSYTLSNVRWASPVPSRCLTIQPTSFSLGYDETVDKDPDTKYNITRNYNGTFNYVYTLNPKPVEPFKKVKFPFQLFAADTGINFNHLPSQIALSTSMKRYYNEIQTRDLTVSYVKRTPSTLLPQWDKDFRLVTHLDIKHDPRARSPSRVMNASIDEVIKDADGNTATYLSTSLICVMWVRGLVRTLEGYCLEQHQAFWYSYRVLSAFLNLWNIPINKLPFLTG